MGSSNRSYRSSREIATNAVLNIRCGFTPTRVKLTNLTTNVEAQWNDSMVDASVYKTVEAGTRSLVTSAGITPIAGTSLLPPGFSIGALADMNDTTTEIIMWEAWG